MRGHGIRELQARPLVMCAQQRFAVGVNAPDMLQSREEALANVRRLQTSQNQKRPLLLSESSAPCKELLQRGLWGIGGVLACKRILLLSLPQSNCSPVMHPPLQPKADIASGTAAPTRCVSRWLPALAGFALYLLRGHWWTLLRLRELSWTFGTHTAAHPDLAALHQPPAVSQMSVCNIVLFPSD